jgi:hypothetical protein
MGTKLPQEEDSVALCCHNWPQERQWLMMSITDCDRGQVAATTYQRSLDCQYVLLVFWILLSIPFLLSPWLVILIHCLFLLLSPAMYLLCVCMWLDVLFDLLLCHSSSWCPSHMDTVFAVSKENEHTYICIPVHTHCTYVTTYIQTCIHTHTHTNTYTPICIPTEMNKYFNQTKTFQFYNLCCPIFQAFDIKCATSNAILLWKAIQVFLQHFSQPGLID